MRGTIEILGVAGIVLLLMLVGAVITWQLAVGFVAGVMVATIYYRRH